jgi:hypothetical protein
MKNPAKNAMTTGASCLSLLSALVLALGLSACESNPSQPAPSTAAVVAPPKAELQFIDLQGFDRDLSGSLSAPLPKVDVAFFDRIVPSALPERLQTWVAAVEAGGGTVKVVPPKSTVTAKNPFLLISAITSVYSASKMAKELSAKAQFKAAQAYDAEIILKGDDKGDPVVERVVFTKRVP